MAKTTESYEVNLSDDEWRKRLSPDQYAVLRRHGTERAGTSPLDKRYDPGTYLCAGCGQQLFSSDTKYDSRSGWPSFWAPLEGATATSDGVACEPSASPNSSFDNAPIFGPVHQFRSVQRIPGAFERGSSERSA